jgi:predicted nucleotidyltransferase component of viral defense system
MKDFFERLNTLGKPRRTDIIEKDFHLHRLLHAISLDAYLRRNLAFKGGTCLIKAYLGYYRFSEDVDFTWRDSAIWKGRSLSETKRRCSKEIDEVLRRVKSISGDLGFGFEGDKSDKSEVHVSSGGRMVLLWLGYDSEVLGVPSRIKVEVNLVDKMLFTVEERKVHSYVERLESRELAFLYEKPWKEYSAKIELPCYDAREIFVEKCRAALTRKVRKLRDVIDIVYMGEKLDFAISDFVPQILDKVRFMLETYERYRDNIELLKGSMSDIGGADEMRLVLGEPLAGIASKIRRVNEQLEEMRKKLLSNR